MSSGSGFVGLVPTGYHVLAFLEYMGCSAERGDGFIWLVRSWNGGDGLVLDIHVLCEEFGLRLVSARV